MSETTPTHEDWGFHFDPVTMKWTTADGCTWVRDNVRRVADADLLPPRAPEVTVSEAMLDAALDVYHGGAIVTGTSTAMLRGRNLMRAVITAALAAREGT